MDRRSLRYVRRGTQPTDTAGSCACSLVSSLAMEVLMILRRKVIKFVLDEKEFFSYNYK